MLILFFRLIVLVNYGYGLGPIFDLNGCQCLFNGLRALRSSIVFALFIVFFMFFNHFCSLLLNSHEVCNERCIVGCNVVVISRGPIVDVLWMSRGFRVTPLPSLHPSSYNSQEDEDGGFL